MDEKTFREFVNFYSDRLYHFAFSFLKNKGLAEEAVSDVFFNVWLKRERLEDIENIKSYLYTATRNTSLNYLDSENRKKAVSLDQITFDFAIESICPESELISKELKLRIESAINKLPPRCKLIYNLAKVEGMKYKDIASVLEISVKTIDHQLSLALKKIGTEIKSYLESNSEGNKFTTLFQIFVLK